MKSLPSLFIISTVISVAGCIALSRPGFGLTITGFVLVAAWILLLIYAFVKFGKRGLWLLLGGVPVLYLVWVCLAILWSCYFGHVCL
jgi:hypothetical protein